MKIVHVVASLAQGQGTAAVAAALSSAQAKRGHDVTLATIAERTPTPEVAAPGVRIVRYKQGLVRFNYFSGAMLRNFGELLRGADWLHIHCQWTFPVWLASATARKLGIPYIMRPAGSFDPVRLKHGRWKKLLASPLDRTALRHAAFVQATCDAERDWIAAFEPRVRRIEVVPNGVEVPPESFRKFPSRRTLLFLGRNHPLKGLDELRAAVDGLDVSLDICHDVFGAEKERRFAEASALVLPSLSENFGLVVAEALARSLPVIATDGTPWAKLSEHSCGWYIDGYRAADRATRVQLLHKTIADFLATPEDTLRTMGRRGREWMLRDFEWPSVAAALEERMQ